MSRDTKPRNSGIAWDADPEADDYLVYVDTTDGADFLSEVDAGNLAPVAVVTETQWQFPAGHPADADHAVVSHQTDADGFERWSNPYSPPEWQDIPLGRAPLAGPSGGRVLSSA